MLGTLLKQTRHPGTQTRVHEVQPRAERTQHLTFCVCGGVWCGVVGECCYLCAAAAWFVRSGQPLGVGTIWFEGVICKMALAVDTVSSGDLRWLFQMKDTGI